RRAQQPDQGASMGASVTDVEVCEIRLTPIFAVRESLPHDEPPSVPRPRPRYTHGHREKHPDRIIVSEVSLRSRKTLACRRRTPNPRNHHFLKNLSFELISAA